MVQAMESFGFSKAARSLELESDVELYPPSALEALDLHKSIINGEWQRVDALLRSASWVDDRMCYAAYKQMYLEMIQGGKLEAALQCLERNLQPAAGALARGQRDEVQKLKMLLMKQTGLDTIVWGGRGASARAQLAVRDLLCSHFFFPFYLRQ